MEADIICLQEVDHYDDFVEHLNKLNYESLFKKRTGNNPDGCAIFWKKDVLLVPRKYTLLIFSNFFLNFFLNVFYFFTFFKFKIIKIIDYIKFS